LPPLKNLAVLYYRVKHKSLKKVAIALPLLDDKAVNSTVFKCFKHLKKHYFTYLLCCPATRVSAQSWVYDVEELLDIWILARPSTECSW